MEQRHPNIVTLQPSTDRLLRSHIVTSDAPLKTGPQSKQISTKVTYEEFFPTSIVVAKRGTLPEKRPRPQPDFDMSDTLSKPARNTVNGTNGNEISCKNEMSSPPNLPLEIVIDFEDRPLSIQRRHTLWNERDDVGASSFEAGYTGTDVATAHKIQSPLTTKLSEPADYAVADEPELREEVENIRRKRKISYSHETKTSGFAKRLAVVISKVPKSTELSKFKMRNCGITTKFLEILTNRINPRMIRILDLGGNKDLELHAVQNLRNKFSSEVIDLSNAQLGAQGIKILGNMKGIKELRLNYRAFTHGSISKALVKLINDGLEKLCLVDSKISNKQLQKLSEGLNDGVSLKVLNLSHVTLDKNGILAVARIVNKIKNGLDELVMSGCRLTTKLLASFEKFAEQEIRELDISSNPLICKGDMEILATMADTLNCKNLDISSNSLNGDHIRQLIVTRTPKQMQKLCLAENPGIDPVAVGELASKWKLLGLDVSECRQNAMAIEDLGKSIGDHTLHCIDVSDPMATVNEEKRKALKLLASKTMKLYYKNHEEFL